MVAAPRANGINHAAVDRFTLAHLAGGYVARIFGLAPAPAAIIAVLWESSEDFLKTTYPDAFPNATHDSKANALADLAAFGVGYWLAGRLKRGK